MMVDDFEMAGLSGQGQGAPNGQHEIPLQTFIPSGEYYWIGGIFIKI